MVEIFLEILKALYKDLRAAGRHGLDIVGGWSTGAIPEHSSCNMPPD
jgi:hypothetical protein